MGGRGLLVALEGSAHGDRFVGSDRVVDRAVGGDLVGEFGAVADVAPVGAGNSAVVVDVPRCGPMLACKQP